MKRPSSATMDTTPTPPSPSKKPAGAIVPGRIRMPCMDDVFKELRKSGLSISSGAFKTKAYKRAEHRCLKAGMTPLNAKIFAREQHTKAVALRATLVEKQGK